ncbi:sarcosine oxidase subunit gamma [Nakamurella sp. GG22]
MAELTRLHPLEQIGIDLAACSNSAVAITPEPFVSMVDVRLPTAAAGAELLGARLPTTPNTWVATSAGRAIWLGPDEWLLTSAAHTPDALDEQARETVQPLGGAVVDVSAQRIGLRLTGSRVREVLAKGCSIDLHPRVFHRGRAAQTTVGLAGVILLGLSDPADTQHGDYLLLVRSSFAVYLAEWLLDAAQEFGTEESSTAESTTRAADPTSSQE